MWTDREFPFVTHIELSFPLKAFKERKLEGTPGLILWALMLPIVNTCTKQLSVSSIKKIPTRVATLIGQSALAISIHRKIGTEQVQSGTPTHDVAYSNWRTSVRQKKLLRSVFDLAKQFDPWDSVGRVRALWDISRSQTTLGIYGIPRVSTRFFASPNRHGVTDNGASWLQLQLT